MYRKTIRAVLPVFGAKVEDEEKFEQSTPPQKQVEKTCTKTKIKG